MTPQMVQQLIDFFTEMIAKIKEVFDKLMGAINSAPGNDEEATEAV